MNTDNEHKDKPAQSGQNAQPAQQEQSQTEDNRQQAIEQEADTARLRSERKSVEDGSGNLAQE